MDEIPLFQAPHHVQFLSKVDILLELEGISHLGHFRFTRSTADPS